MAAPKHQHMTYNDIHHLIRDSAERIKEFRPDMFIAIGEFPAEPNPPYA